MQTSVVRFSENIQLGCGLVSAAILAVFSHFALEDKQVAGLPAITIGHIAAVCLALWSLRSMGVSNIVTPTALTRKTLFGEFRIRWDEMEWLEIGPSCMWLVFHGAGKRIWMRKPASSAEAWVRNDEDHIDPLFTDLIDTVEARDIPIGSGLFTAFKVSRG